MSKREPWIEIFRVEEQRRLQVRNDSQLAAWARTASIVARRGMK